MRAGRLDRFVTIQHKSESSSDSGEPQVTWTTLIARREASIWTPQAGDEQFREPQLAARERVEWLVRYSANVAGLNPREHRIVYPALSEASPEDVPDERNIYDIVAVHEFGRQEGLRIVTARRPDVIP